MKKINKLDAVLSLMEGIRNVTYASVILLENDQIKTKKTNNYNGWEDYYFGNNHDNDCVLIKIARKIMQLNKGKHEYILWDKAAGEKDPIQQKRKISNMHYGISLIYKANNNVDWCISACSDKDSRRAQFHEEFFSKTSKIFDLIHQEEG